MKQLDDFLAFLLPHVPGVPIPTAHQALVMAAIEFCERSAVVQEISEQQAVAGVSHYDVDEPQEQTLVRVIDIVYGGRAMDVASYPVADMPDGRPMYALMPLPTQVEFQVAPPPAPEHVATITVRAAFKPKPDAGMLHDDLYNEWLDAVVQGALRRLYVMPAQGFTSMTNAQIAGQSFERWITDARMIASRKRLVGSARVRPRPFA